MRSGATTDRDACSVALDRVRNAIASGRFAAGRFLPPVRELSAKYGVSPETIRRGLNTLEREGLVVAKARQGFRVAARSGGDAGCCPVA